MLVHGRANVILTEKMPDFFRVRLVVEPRSLEKHLPHKQRHVHGLVVKRVNCLVSLYICPLLFVLYIR